MTRHRATALLGVAAAMLLTAGALAAGSPAFAAGDSVKVSVLPLQTFTPGQTQTLQVQIEYKRDPKSTAPGTFQVSLSGLGGDFTVGNPEGCAFPCVVTFADSDSKVVKFPIKASGDVQPGDKKNANGKVTAAGFNDVNDSANFSATINGPEQAQTVTQVSGTVKDPNGAAVANATVAMLDGGSCTTSNRCETATNSRGEFSFKPKPDKPIVPGTIRIGATRSGFEVGQATQDARAGQSVTINLTLRPKAAATSSANASEEALPAPPSDAAATTQQAAQPETTKTSDSGSSAFS